MSDVFDRMLAPAEADSRCYGVSCGIVTNTRDPEGLGRVKVKLPWMADDLQSAWARVAAPMAGPGCGAYFLPAVDDEVLVAFEHGSPEFPYVVGALWNGTDRPPVSNSDGRNEVRMIRSRRGHSIRLVDAEGGELIEIVDRSGRNRIVLSTAGDGITITSDTGRLTLRGATVEIEATGGPLDLKGRVVKIN